MNVNPITNQQSFDGKLILKNKMTAKQNHMFSIQKPVIEKR